MNKLEFAIALKPIEVITGKKFTEDQINIYHMLIKTTLEDLQKGIIKLCMERKFTNIPTPAEILEYCNGTKLDLDGQALIAANKLKKAIRGIGKYESVAFDDYLIHKVIKASYGSWVKICKIDLDELETFLKWDFGKLYKTYATYKNLEDLPIYLVGSHEASNLALQTTPKIKYIGDKQKCLKWQTVLSDNNKLIDNDKLVALGFEEEVKKIENNNIDVKKLIEEGKEKFKIDAPEKKEGPVRTKEELKELLKIKLMEG